MNAQPPRIVAVGEILWDLLPAGRQMGGAPANFACHARALGADARIISRVGDDPLGREILQRLKELHVPVNGVSVDPEKPTGTVSVELAADGQPRFTIHGDVAWDRLQSDPTATEIVASADVICFGSLAQRGEPSRSAIRALVSAAPAGAIRVFDVNLRQNFYSRELIEASLKLANVMKLNDTELPVVAKFFDLHGAPLEQLKGLAERFDLKCVALTRGGQGSLLLSHGRASDHPGVPVSVVDTVGAGDAFTAALTVGMLAGWDLDDINQRANEVAAHVASCTGATPVLPDRLREPFRAKQPVP